jgi:hypothetical protein
MKRAERLDRRVLESSVEQLLAGQQVFDLGYAWYRFYDCVDEESE